MAFIWNKIWKASVPRKVKICAWKVCFNIPPTHSNLEKKRVAVDNICVLCSSSLELALHVFSAFPFAQAMFLFSNMNSDQRPLTYSSIWDWFSAAIGSLSPTFCNLFLMLIHSIWRARNALLWDGELENPTLVSYSANLQLNAFMKAQPTSQPRCLHLTSQWLV